MAGAAGAVVTGGEAAGFDGALWPSADRLPAAWALTVATVAAAS